MKISNEYKGKLVFLSLGIILIILIGLFVYGRVHNLLKPLYGKNLEIGDSGYVEVDSEYVRLEVIDQGETFKIYRDMDTDVLYMNVMGTLYSSSLSPIYKEDGEVMKYPDYN